MDERKIDTEHQRWEAGDKPIMLVTFIISLRKQEYIQRFDCNNLWN